LSSRSYCGTVEDHDQLPQLCVTQAQLEEAEELVFGKNDEFKGVSIAAYCDSLWSRLTEQFYRERLVHVRSNNVLLLRFSYDYEVDLDRIKEERDLLAWTLHLVGKPWMTPRRTKQFIKAVAQIKGFNVRLS
jgi:hypothetical protein